ncbi:RCC1 domain-containing protein [Lysinibacter sp. HNR]|uniref:RCC1 domain-containing protein n=1 Tax=Lysinibacter sp. HNR TaxID=3031408 RepID=UPI002434C7C5|nr:RCC1 domain-containing protein [Lysinibacter sp. HNR]WGD36543.1 hypothetical protein FrondiHNR_08670 [Lysinibacter sp. HNR]
MVAISATFSIIVGVLGVIPAGALWSTRGNVEASVQSDQLVAPPGGSVAINGGNSLTFDMSTGGQKSQTLPTRYTLERSATEDFGDPVVVSSGEAERVTDTGGPLSEEFREVQFDTIATGSEAACGLREGTAWCWGNNLAGQLGQGTRAGNSATPIPVKTSAESASSALPVNAKLTLLDAGYEFVCTSDGTSVWCWGTGYGPQLGVEASQRRTHLFPTRVEGIPAGEIIDLSVGSRQACFVVKDDNAYCWGLSLLGMLGNGTSLNSTVPVPVFRGEPLSQLPREATITRVAAGIRTTCLIASGAAYCSGSNNGSQPGGYLGDGTTVSHSLYMRKVVQGSPSQIPAGATITDISAGSVDGNSGASSGYVGGTCVIANDRPYCWGSGEFGALGNGGNLPYSNTARAVSNIPTGALKGISVGTLTGCVVHSNGNSYCWGANASGQLGVGNLTSALSAVAVPNPAGKTVASISSSGYLATSTTYSPGAGLRCWLYTDGTAGCAGLGTNGALGEGNTGRMGATNSTIGNVLMPKVAVCVAGAVSVGTQCVLAPGTNYFYRLSYSIGQWQSPLSEVFRVETAASVRP